MTASGYQPDPGAVLTQALDAETRAEAEDYRILRDHIIEKLNPRDDDLSEVAIMCNVISSAAAYIEGQPCTCTPGSVETFDHVCLRCWVLNRAEDRRLDP